MAGVSDSLASTNRIATPATHRALVIHSNARAMALSTVLLISSMACVRPPTPIMVWEICAAKRATRQAGCTFSSSFNFRSTESLLI